MRHDKLFTTYKKSTDQNYVESSDIKTLLLAFIFDIC